MDFQDYIPNSTSTQAGGSPSGEMPFSARAPRQQENAMSTAAMIVGIIGAISTFLLPFYLPCLLGSISIVLGLLSKDGSNKLLSHAKAGILTSVCSLILNVFILIGCFYLVFHVPEFHAQFEQMYEQMYGESFDDTLGRALEN